MNDSAEVALCVTSAETRSVEASVDCSRFKTILAPAAEGIGYSFSDFAEA